MSTLETVNTWKRVARMELEDMIGFQVTVYCYLNSIVLSPERVKVLAILGSSGEVELGPFCRTLSNRYLYTSEQGARNAVAELEDIGLVIKRPVGGKKKLVCIAPAVGICNTLPLLADIKIVSQ